MKTTTIAVAGMTCGGCVASVTRALKAVPGVHEVQVTLTPGAAKVSFDESNTSEADIKTAIEDAGYDAA